MHSGCQLVTRNGHTVVQIYLFAIEVINGLKTLVLYEKIQLGAKLLCLVALGSKSVFLSAIATHVATYLGDVLFGINCDLRCFDVVTVCQCRPHIRDTDIRPKLVLFSVLVCLLSCVLDDCQHS